MENMTYQKALTSMGYRAMQMKQLKTKMWMKPIGFCTIGCFKEDGKLKFAVYMMGQNKEPLIWKRDGIDLTEFSDNDNLDITLTIKMVEANILSSTTPIISNESSHYEFLTPMDNANIIANVIG